MLGGGQIPQNDTKNIEMIEVEFLIDNAKSKIIYYNPLPNTPLADNFTGVEFGTNITSISGQSKYEENRFVTSFNNPEVLGQTIRGHLSVFFFEDPRKVNIDILKIRSHNSSIFDHVDQTYTIIYNGIPYCQSYSDSYMELEIDEYYITGSSLNSAKASFTEDNAIYYDITETTVCGSRSYIKV